jgi:hypothetical protein
VVDLNGIKNLKYLITSIFTLVIGFVLYVFFRGKELLFYKFINKLGFKNIVFQDWNIDTTIPDIIKYNVPDGLWLLSGIFIIRWIWLRQNIISSIYVSVFFLCALVFETLQYYGVINGTYDRVDIIVLAVAYSTEELLYIFKEKRSCEN